jgi:predicted permease
VGVNENGSNGVPDYLDRKQLAAFDSLAILGTSGYEVGAQGSPARIDGEFVSPSYFQVLRTTPLMGRAFTEDDAVQGKDHSVILSHGLWKSMFGRDPNLIGKDVRLSGVPYRIVGIMPEGFESPLSEARLWVPFAFRPEQTKEDQRHSNNWSIIARLKPGVSMEQTRAQVEALNRQNTERSPYRKLLIDAHFYTRVAGLKDELVKDVKPTLYLLEGAVVFVLLIGCVNVANLMLVRSNIRLKELAIRFAMGAGRVRLGRQLLTESVTLAALGGVLGVATGLAGVRLLALLGSNDLPRGAHIAIDGSVLGFSAAVAVFTGLAFGSVPIYHLMRRDLNSIFRQSGRTGTAERRALLTRSALVVCQVGLAFILLIGAGLLTLSFSRLLAVSPGFQPQSVVTARFTLPRPRYNDDARARTTIASVIEKVRAFPGVTAVGATNFLPFTNNNNSSVATIGGYTRAPGENPPVPAWNNVNPGYFQALGIPLMQGRVFQDSDTAAGPKVVVIDEFLARKYWPKGNAIGAQIWRGLDTRLPAYTVVGVVGNVKTNDLADQNPIGQIYFDYQQDTPRSVHLVVKTTRDGGQVNAELRRALQAADPDLPLYDVKSMSERVAGSVRNRRAAMIVCLVFACLALTLSAIGIYGVLAYTVTQRTREFGIRMALGAEAGMVVRMVLWHGVKLAAIGLLVGLGGAFALTRLMTALLYSVKPTDPVVYVAVAAALMVVALAASLVPSLRALRIHPSVALRYE